MSSIEWTERTWNPAIGCSKVSEGCRNCYAERMSSRLANMGKPDYLQVVHIEGIGPRGQAGHKALPKFNGEILELQHRLRDPFSWKRPRMVFVNSMSDLFHPKVSENLIDRVFAIMALTPQHTYQVLTKRPERALEYLAGRYKPGSICDAAIAMDLAVHRVDWLEHDSGSYERISGPQWPLPNVWIGTSVEDQETADERIPILLKTPAAIRFISAEPILDEIDLNTSDKSGPIAPLDWVIVGGESGPGARICDLRWIRRIVNDCQAAEVPVFVKQLGAKPRSEYKGLGLKNRKGADPAEWPADLQVREMPRPIGSPAA